MTELAKNLPEWGLFIVVMVVVIVWSVQQLRDRRAASGQSERPRTVPPSSLTRADMELMSQRVRDLDTYKIPAIERSIERMADLMQRVTESTQCVAQALTMQTELLREIRDEERAAHKRIDKALEGR